MISLKDSVYSQPDFGKKAEYKLPTESSEWNEEILKQFYSDVNYLPKELNVDVSVNNIDEKKGYAKGSIVVFTGENRINFPVIVKDFMLSPFDTFVDKINGQAVYRAASLRNIKKALSTEKQGKLENYWGKGDPRPAVKSTGGIYPKQSVSINDTDINSNYPAFSKMSSWPFLSKKEDLEKLAIQMEANPDVEASFVDNTGDLVGNIIDLKNNDNYQKVITDDHKEGSLDLNNVVKAKRVVTVIDSELIRPEDLMPIKAPNVCELRLHAFPTMEDFIESGSDSSERLEATKSGKPVSGIVINYKESYGYRDFDGVERTSDGKANIRDRKPQMFISACGCYYSLFKDYDKHGVGFYGTKVLDMPGALKKTIAKISENTTDDFINVNRDNNNDGSDKLFYPNLEKEEGIKGKQNNPEPPHFEDNVKMIVIYKTGDSFEAIEFNGNFKKKKVNDNNVYASNDNVIIPANVDMVQKVNSVKTPIYKMIVGKAKNIFLVPEGSVVINTEYMNCLNPNDFMRPDKAAQKAYEDSEISKVAVCVSSDKDALGYKITGNPFSSLSKVAGVGNKVLNTKEALGALQVMGTTMGRANEILKVAVNRYSDRKQENKNVIVYGLNDDYINKNVFDEREKTAKIHSLVKEYAYSLRRDLVKEASVLNDPDAVDVVLSLNFINEDSIAGYVENIEEMKRISSDLSKMLIAARMGLSDLNESALKKAIYGLNDVIEGLENLKMATSEESQ